MKSALVLPALVLLLVVLSVTASAAVTTSPQYDMAIWSADFQPSSTVFINVTGPANMTVSILITDGEHNIVGGKNTQLDVTGNYTFPFVPNKEGTFNATAQFETGVTLTRSFLIQQRVTQAQIGNIYRTIFDGFGRLADQIAALDSKIDVAIVMIVISLIFGGLMYNHVRTHYSKADSEFQRFMKADVETAVGRLLRQTKAQEAAEEE